MLTKLRKGALVALVFPLALVFFSRPTRGEIIALSLLMFGLLLFASSGYFTRRSLSVAERIGRFTLALFVWGFCTAAYAWHFWPQVQGDQLHLPDAKPISEKPISGPSPISAPQPIPETPKPEPPKPPLPDNAALLREIRDLRNDVKSLREGKSNPKPPTKQTQRTIDSLRWVCGQWQEADLGYGNELYDLNGGYINIPEAQRRVSIIETEKRREADDAVYLERLVVSIESATEVQTTLLSVVGTQTEEDKNFTSFLQTMQNSNMRQLYKKSSDCPTADTHRIADYLETLATRVPR